MPTDVETLMEMGFSQNRAQRALSKTHYRGVTDAMDWLVAHENDADIDDEFEVPPGQAIGNKGETPMDASPSVEAPLQAKSLKCDECGKLLQSEGAVQMHAARSGHSQFSESVEEIKPLTDEERHAQMLKAQELLKQKRLEREEKEKQEQLEREKQRRVHGKEMIQIKQKMQDDEMKKIMDDRKREKEAEKQARQRVREQIEKDKLDRAVKFGTVPPAGDQHAATGASTQTKTPVASATSPTPPREYDETNLQIRLLSGETITQRFKVTEPLAAVRLFVHGKLTQGQMHGDFTGLTFATSYPRKVFTEDDMLTPLKLLGLVPSAALMLTKAPSAS